MLNAGKWCKTSQAGVFFCFLRERERDPRPAAVRLALRYMRLLIRLKSREMKVERNRGCKEEEKEGEKKGDALCL